MQTLRGCHAVDSQKPHVESVARFINSTFKTDGGTVVNDAPPPSLHLIQSLRAKMKMKVDLTWVWSCQPTPATVKMRPTRTGARQAMRTSEETNLEYYWRWSARWLSGIHNPALDVSNKLQGDYCPSSVFRFISWTTQNKWTSQRFLKVFSVSYFWLDYFIVYTNTICAVHFLQADRSIMKLSKCKFYPARLVILESWANPGWFWNDLGLTRVVFWADL